MRIHRLIDMAILSNMVSILTDCPQREKLGWLEPVSYTHLDVYKRQWLMHNTSPIGLLVWGDDVAIGDDNDPTTFGRPFFSSANLLLNCLFYQDLLASAELARRLGRPADHERRVIPQRGEAADDTIPIACYAIPEHVTGEDDISCLLYTSRCV